MSKNKLIVISGCSSGGKSTLIAELKLNGYTTLQEVGREIVKEQLALNSNLLPWQDMNGFCDRMISRSITCYHEAAKLNNVKDNVIFFDRSFLEGVSYFQSINIDQYNYLIDDMRFYPTIFMTPPWKEIFCEDVERKNSFESSVQEYERLLKFYHKYAYVPVELPKLDVKERFEFVMSQLDLKN